MRRSVLVVGSSSVSVSDEAESITLTTLLEEELAGRIPDIEWDITAERIYQGDGMLERVQAAVEEHSPDVMFLKFTTYQLTHREVLWSVRDNWPAIYPAARFLNRQFTRLAGGPTVFANTSRPWVWTLPKKAALRVFGEAPGTSLESAIGNTTKAIDYLLAREDVDVFGWMSSDGRGRTYPDPKVDADVKSFWSQLQSYFDRRHVPHFTSLQMRRGQQKVYAADGLHANAPETRMRAAFLADRVLEALELAPQASPLL